MAIPMSSVTPSRSKRVRFNLLSPNDNPSNQTSTTNHLTPLNKDTNDLISPPPQYNLSLIDDEEYYEDLQNAYDSDSSQLSLSSSPSERVKQFMAEHNIPPSRINKHFRLKSQSSTKSRTKSPPRGHSHVKHVQINNNNKSHKLKPKSKTNESLFMNMLPSASHGFIRVNKKSPSPPPNRHKQPSTASEQDEDEANIDDDDEDEDLLSNKRTSRLTTHHYWTRLTIQCACCGIGIIEFGWSIVECLIIPFLFLSDTPYFCISWILFFIPMFDSWLQPLIYVNFTKLIYKHHHYYYAQLMLIIFSILFLFGCIIIPHSNVLSAQIFGPYHHRFGLFADPNPNSDSDSDSDSNGGADGDSDTMDDSNDTVYPIRLFISIFGYTIMNLCLGYLLIPLRFIMNDAAAKISSKQYFSLRKKVIEAIMNDANRRYICLSKTAERNYISSFDALATQIYNVNEYNHYLKYTQRSISMYQIIGRCFGYLFASIDWLSFAFVREQKSDNWSFLFSHKYGHIDLCFTFTCLITIIGLLIVNVFTLYVHAYAMKKIRKKKKNFYRFKTQLEKKYKSKSSATPASINPLIPAKSVPERSAIHSAKSSTANLHHFSSFLNRPQAMVPQISAGRMTKSPLTPYSIRSKSNMIMFNINNDTLMDGINDSLQSLVPTLQSKLSFDLTRICNINPRTKSCFYIIDGIQLHQESIQIYMDWHLNQKLNQKSETNTPSKQSLDQWKLISVSGASAWRDNKKDSLFDIKLNLTPNNSTKSDYTKPLSMPFELALFWWLIYFGWLCVIAFLYFFTIFVAQQISPWSEQRQKADISAEENRLMAGIRYACLILVFNVVSAVLVQLFIIDQVLSINQCKTLLFLSEFGIALSLILFYFAHTVYHPSFIILIVITLGFFIQLHYNLPYLLIEYKLIAIRHKETRRQYRILSYYCSLMNDQNESNTNQVDMTRFDYFKNSNKLMQIEQLKQHILQRYNLAMFFAMITVSVFTGVFILLFLEWKNGDIDDENDKNVDENENRFVFSLVLVSWGCISMIGDIILFVAYLIYHSCYKPYKKRKRQRKHQKQRELDEWRIRRLNNNTNYAGYCTFTQMSSISVPESTKNEKGIRSFIKDKSSTIYENLNVLKELNKNRPIQRASASTLKLFELKKDLRQKYKIKLNAFGGDRGDELSVKSTSTESYLEFSTSSQRDQMMAERQRMDNTSKMNMKYRGRAADLLMDEVDDEDDEVLVNEMRHVHVAENELVDEEEKNLDEDAFSSEMMDMEMMQLDIEYEQEDEKYHQQETENEDGSSFSPNKAVTAMSSISPTLLIHEITTKPRDQLHFAAHYQQQQRKRDRERYLMRKHKMENIGGNDIVYVDEFQRKRLSQSLLTHTNTRYGTFRPGIL